MNVEKESAYFITSIDKKLNKINKNLNAIVQWMVNSIKLLPENSVNLKYDIVKNELAVLQVFIDVHLVLDSFIEEKNISVTDEVNQTTENSKNKVQLLDSILQKPTKVCCNETNLILPEVQGTDKNPVIENCDIKIENHSSENLNSNSFYKNINTDTRAQLLILETSTNSTPAFYELREAEIDDVNAVCTFSHIESISEFYLHFHHDLFTDLNISLNANLCNSTVQYKSKIEAKNCIGKYCLAYSSNRLSWCRAEVLDWMILNDSNQVMLHSVDYGNKELCSFEKLQPMNDVYSKVPKLAVRCHLAKIPSQLFNWKNSLEYSDNIIKAFIELSGLFSTVLKKFEIVSVEKLSDSFYVNLYELGTDERVTIIQSLINRKVINEAIDILPENCVETYETKPYNEAFNKTFLSLIGSEISIIITSFINPCSFYINILENNSVYNVHLCNLIGELNKKSVTETFEPYGTLPEEGEIVVFLHWTRKWFRGKVLEINNHQIEIFVVDFGDVCKTYLYRIRRIPRRFLCLPFQAIECYLVDYYPSSNINISSFISFCGVYVNFRPLKAAVIANAFPLQLKLHKIQGLDIVKTMKELNFIFDIPTSIKTSVVKCIPDRNI